jgi:tRNA-dihydrouridine synthase A
MARHLLGLFHGEPGARRWRRMISENLHRSDATAALLLQAVPGRP